MTGNEKDAGDRQLQFLLPPPANIQFLAANLSSATTPAASNKRQTMGRRVRSGSIVNNTNNARNNVADTDLNKPRSANDESPIPAAAGMSPGSRYNHNLKVLRRRDPSIVSIFDQFSHVCLYHHDGEKWEKKGYEGSMFLYERFVCNSSKIVALL